MIFDLLENEKVHITRKTLVISPQFKDAFFACV